jgi:hypothetical protein
MPLKHLNDEVDARSKLWLHFGVPFSTATVQTRDWFSGRWSHTPKQWCKTSPNERLYDIYMRIILHNFIMQTNYWMHFSLCYCVAHVSSYDYCNEQLEYSFEYDSIFSLCYFHWLEIVWHTDNITVQQRIIMNYLVLIVKLKESNAGSHLTTQPSGVSW